MLDRKKIISKIWKLKWNIVCKNVIKNWKKLEEKDIIRNGEKKKEKYRGLYKSKKDSNKVM